MGSIKVGDKVRCIKRPVDNASNQSLLHKTGTVDKVHPSSVTVKWEDWHDGWDANGSTWNVMHEEIELVKGQPGLFKVGDKVIIKERGNERYGETATVISDDGVGGGIFPVKVRRQDGRAEAFARHNLELVASEAGLYVVIVEKDGKLAPATTPKTYGTAALAQYVADDMAKRHGGKFYVFRATYESVNTVSSRSL